MVVGGGRVGKACGSVCDEIRHGFHNSISLILVFEKKERLHQSHAKEWSGDGACSHMWMIGNCSSCFNDKFHEH